MKQQSKRQIEHPSSLRVALWEFRIALRSDGVRLTLLLFALLLTVALVFGSIRTQNRQIEAQHTEQENQWVSKVLCEAIQGLPTSEHDKNSLPSSTFRKEKQLRLIARSPQLISHAANLWSISIDPSPLSCLSVGASPFWPDRYSIVGLSLSKTLKRSDQISPWVSPFGFFDATFVVMAIAPLVVIGLTFNASSSDRERGLQKIILAQTPHLAHWMAVRCFARATMVILVIICVVVGILVFVQGSQFNLRYLVILAIWNTTTALYLLVWAAFGLFVNSLGRTSSTNGVALLLVWVILVLLVPQFTSSLVQQNVATRGESDLAEREEDMIVRVSGDSDTLLQQFQLANPNLELRSDDPQHMTLTRYLLAHHAAGANVTEMVSAHYSGHLQRLGWLDLADLLSPTISIRNASDQCSENSEFASIAFATHAGNVHAKLIETFLLPSIANEESTVQHIAALPRLHEATIPGRISKRTVLFATGSLLIWLVLFTVLGYRNTSLRNRCGERDDRMQEGVGNA